MVTFPSGVINISGLHLCSVIDVNRQDETRVGCYDWIGMVRTSFSSELMLRLDLLDRHPSCTVALSDWDTR